MSYRKEINIASSVFFFIGAVLYKAQYLPIPAISNLVTPIALGCYLIAYLLWGMAFRPLSLSSLSWIASEHREHIIAALFGLAATILCLLVATNPILAVVGLWIYVASNLFWCYAEYKSWQKLTDQISIAQGAYFGYAVCLTLIALTVAIAAIFPPSFLAIALTGGFCAGIALIAGIFYAQSWDDQALNSFEVFKTASSFDNARFQQIQDLDIQSPRFFKTLSDEPTAHRNFNFLNKIKISEEANPQINPDKVSQSL